MNSQDIIIDAQEKRQGFDYGYYPKMFSAYFRNIRELQNFLYFSRHFLGGISTVNLGLAFKVWISIRN